MIYKYGLNFACTGIVITLFQSSNLFCLDRTRKERLGCRMMSLDIPLKVLYNDPPYLLIHVLYSIFTAKLSGILCCRLLPNFILAIGQISRKKVHYTLVAFYETSFAVSNRKFNEKISFNKRN